MTTTASAEPRYQVTITYPDGRTVIRETSLKANADALVLTATKRGCSAELIDRQGEVTK